MKIAACAMAVVLASSAPVLADQRGALDGRAFAVAVTYTNGHLRRHTRLTFAHGRLTTSSAFDGVADMPYVARDKNGAITFHAGGASGDGEGGTDVRWEGTVRDDAIAGTLVVVQKTLGSHLVFRGGARHEITDR